MTNEIKFFTWFYVDKLYRQVASTENYDNYLLDSFPFEEIYAKGPTGIEIPNDFKLMPGKENDLVNSIALHEIIGNISEVQASDERLWTYLVHARFWDYMRERWPVEKAKNPVSRVRRRYFVRGLSLESLARNGLSRLWWYAHLTVDNNRTNKYELLEVLLSKQDIVAGITERAFWANSTLRESVLEFLLENPDLASNEKDTRELFKGLNLIGGVKVLPLLENQEIKKMLNIVKSSILAA